MKKARKSLGSQSYGRENARLSDNSQRKKKKVLALLGPLFIGPKGLGTRNVKTISTIRYSRSNDPQHLPPEKPFINAHHVTPPKVTSRLGKPNSHAPKGGWPTPIIKDSSDISALEPGGKCTGMGETEIRSTWPRPGKPGWDQGSLAETREITTDGPANRHINPLTLKPRSAKLIYH